MKAKVVNSASDYYLITIDVKSINFKYVSGIGNDLEKRVRLPYEDVEFLYDHEWEKDIVKHRDILRVSLPPKVSPEFYAFLSCALEAHIKGGIRGVSILSDTNEPARKKYWYKRIIAVINDSRPVLITSYGKEYAGKYNINIEDMNREEFICECNCGIDRTKKAIDTGIKQVEFYQKILFNVITFNGETKDQKLLEEGSPPPEYQKQSI